MKKTLSDHFKNALIIGASSQSVQSSIDEVAVLLKDTFRLSQFIEVAKEAGWEHFNGANDTVSYNAFGESDVYEVRYEFFRHPDYSFRIEAMAITGGRPGPVHRNRPEGPIHVSWKPGPTFLDYSLGMVAFDRSGGVKIQECGSTYGAFSYWNHHMSDLTGVYWKPRINLRDAGKNS